MKKIRVLIAENYSIMRGSIVQFLQNEPDMKVVAQASNGKEGLKLIAEFRPDVVVTDTAMPELNGIEMTKRIKELYPSIAVIILTAYDYEHYIFDLLEAGAAGYLPKCVQIHEVINAIRTVYIGESILHPVIARRVIEHLKTSTSKEARVAEILTKREMEVLSLAANGLTNNEIAYKLNLSPRTIQVHLANIFSKLEVASRTEAILYGLKRGWLILEDLP
jgi:DNA-binding NarL/FixJ family response regulator